MFLELGDKIQRGKERFAFFITLSLVSYFLIGIYVPDEARNRCDLDNIFSVCIWR